jgi:NitT/TauT family transport system substrate-binding protein
MKAIFGMALAAALLWSPAASWAQPKLEKLTITSGGDGMHYFPVYVARGGGFFAKEGIEVDWVNVNSGTRQAASIMGGSADMTPMALFHVIKARGEGADLVAISSVFDVYGMTVVLSNEAIQKVGITPTMALDEKVKRLQGLKIGISSPGSSTDALIRSILLARGYDPDKTVSLMPFGNGASILAAFEKKLSDGLVYVAPVPETIEQRGLGKSIINPFLREVPELNDVPYVIMATSRATLEKKGDLIARSMRAMARAMEFAHAKPDETCKIVRQYFTDLDEEVFKIACERYRKSSSQSPVLTRNQIEKTAAWMSIGEKRQITAKFEDVVDDSVARKAVTAIKNQ